VSAGLAAGHAPEVVFVLDGSDVCREVAAGASLAGLPVQLLTERVATKLTTLQTPPDVMAVFPLPTAAVPEDLRGDSQALVVYADRVADPGNMGTLVRAAAAFAAAALTSSPGSVDLFSPKVVRSGMGAVFALPLCQDQPLYALANALGRPRVYGLVAHGGTDIRAADLRLPAVLCVGAERAGLDPKVLDHVDERLTIPLAGEGGAAIESLNAGVAGAIALYEFSRRGAGAPRGGRRAPRTATKE